MDNMLKEYIEKLKLVDTVAEIYGEQILTGVLMERKSGLLFCNLSICKG